MIELRADLRARLDAAVGTAQVLTAADDVAPYVTDWRGRFHGRALAVVRPGSTAAVAAVVRACADLRVPDRRRRAAIRASAAARRRTPAATPSSSR